MVENNICETTAINDSAIQSNTINNDLVSTRVEKRKDGLDSTENKIIDKAVKKPKQVHFQDLIDTNNTNINKKTSEAKTLSISSHPFGVKPLGNFYIDHPESKEQIIRGKSLGYLGVLSDEMILNLISHFESTEILKFSMLSSFFYAFSYFEETWKERVIKEFDGDFDFMGSWRLTYIYCKFSVILPSYELNPFPVKARNVYSDFLYQPWLCSSTSMQPFIGKENIDRRENLSLQEFIDQYEIPNKPVIITDALKNWSASGNWTEENLKALYGNVKFRAEAVDISLNRYFKYAHNNIDESPVYLFDKKFGQNCPDMLKDFQVPEYFNDDLFQLLGDDRRPDYRWLIIGPERSGSTFHKDPNATSAWNAVLTGAKKWIMFPPECPPPGVFTNKDESEVTSPVSIMDWHLHYYHEAVNEMEVKPIEAICRAGEIMFVPSGWWHLVVNLEDSIALTQNYVSHQNAEKVLNFLYHKPDQVSGWKFDPLCCDKEEFDSLNPAFKKESLFDAFSKKYEKVNPTLVAKVKSIPPKWNPAPSTWDLLTNEASGSGFQFGFSFSDSENSE